MWNDATVVLKNFHGLTPPDQKVLKARERKVKQIIESMGDKYLLAKQVEKLN